MRAKQNYLKHLKRATEKTDRKLTAMERKLKGIYSRTNRELTEKWQKHLDRLKPKAEKLEKAIADAKTKEEIDKAKKEYQDFLRKNTLAEKTHQERVKQISAELVNTDKTAIAYLNGKLPEIYALNYNAMNKSIGDQVSGYSFNLLNKNVVKNLATENKSLLPYKTVDELKVLRYNVKKVNAEVLQGILQGEPIDKIAKRLERVTQMNYNSAKLNARTMVTGTQNKGRMDTLRDAKDMGVQAKKVWLASSDERTRDWHAELDGVALLEEEPFENEYGEIMYPGDPDADPANVYNCRCSLGYEIIGFWNR